MTSRFEIGRRIRSGMRRSIGVGAVVLAVVAALAGCGGDEPYDADSVELTLVDSPINQRLGLDIALRSGDLIELEREAERAVVECMLQAGFEYQPIDFAAQFEPESGAEDPDSRAYAEANGYGISISPSFSALGPADIVDPNEEIRALLSDAELEAYQLALFGEPPADGEPVDASTQGGCVPMAYQQVYAAQAELGRVEQFFGEYGEELAELEQRFRSDQRFLELEAQWADCMAEQGFAVSSREDIFIELNRRMTEVAEHLEDHDGDHGGEDDGHTHGGSTLEDLSPEHQALIDEVNEWERSVAVAEWDCNQPVQDDMQALRYGYEALFLERHGDALDP